MKRNYGNKKERVGIKRFYGKEGDKWMLMIMVEEHEWIGILGITEKIVGAGWKALEYKEKKWNLWKNVADLRHINSY